MHYYQFNIGDYAAHTRGLTLLEDLAYRRLMDEYYLSEHPLNGNAFDVARLIGFVEHQKEVEYVLKRFFIESNGVFCHNRIDDEILFYKSKQEKASNAGKLSAKKRLENNGLSGNNEQTFNERSTDVQLTNNHEPITNNQLEENTYVQEDVKNSANKIANCEYQKVIDVYHECLPELSKARLLTKARERLIKQRWNWILTSKKPDGERRATNAQEALVWFENYFNRVRDNDFLMGRVKQSNDHKNWKCDIDFLMEDRGLKHVIEKTEG